MTTILEVIESADGIGIFKVRCDHCGREFETAGTVQSIERRKRCQKCRPRSNSFSKMSPERRRECGRLGAQARGRT